MSSCRQTADSPARHASKKGPAVVEAGRLPIHHFERGANPLIRQVRRVVNRCANRRGVVTVLVSERCSSHGRVCLKIQPRSPEHPGLSTLQRYGVPEACIGGCTPGSYTATHKGHIWRCHGEPHGSARQPVGAALACRAKGFLVGEEGMCGFDYMKGRTESSLATPARLRNRPSQLVDLLSS